RGPNERILITLAADGEEEAWRECVLRFAVVREATHGVCAPRHVIAATRELGVRFEIAAREREVECHDALIVRAPTLASELRRADRMVEVRSNRERRTDARADDWCKSRTNSGAKSGCCSRDISEV